MVKTQTWEKTRRSLHFFAENVNKQKKIHQKNLIHQRDWSYLWNMLAKKKNFAKKLLTHTLTNIAKNLRGKKKSKKIPVIQFCY